jgi:hypothetical protein
MHEGRLAFVVDGGRTDDRDAARLVRERLTERRGRNRFG